MAIVRSRLTCMAPNIANNKCDFNPYSICCNY